MVRSDLRLLMLPDWTFFADVFGLSTFLGHFKCHQQTVFGDFQIDFVFYKTFLNPNNLIKNIMLIVKPLELHDF